MNVVLYSRFGKERLLVEALRQRGHTVDVDPSLIDLRMVDALLMEYPAAWGGWRLQMSQDVAASGIPVFSYPHGAPPLVQFDGCVEPFRGLAAELVHAPGHQEFYELIGYPCPVEVIGWSYCEQVPFHRPEQIEHLLFAPAHPLASGAFLPEWQQANARAYRLFLDHPAPRKTVRMFGTLEANGLWADDRAVFTETDQDLGVAMIDQIDSADYVIANGTFAYLSVARGKPVVMFGQEIHPTDDFATRKVRSWDKWKDMLRYPFDVDDGPDVIDRAAEVPEWRSRWIGEPLDGDRLVEILES